MFSKDKITLISYIKWKFPPILLWAELWTMFLYYAKARALARAAGSHTPLQTTSLSCVAKRSTKLQTPCKKAEMECICKAPRPEHTFIRVKSTNSLMRWNRDVCPVSAEPRASNYQGQNCTLFVHDVYVFTHSPMSRSVNKALSRCEGPNPSKSCRPLHTFPKGETPVCS